MIPLVILFVIGGVMALFVFASLAFVMVRLACLATHGLVLAVLGGAALAGVLVVSAPYQPQGAETVQVARANDEAPDRPDTDRAPAEVEEGTPAEVEEGTSAEVEKGTSAADAVEATGDPDLSTPSDETVVEEVGSQAKARSLAERQGAGDTHHDGDTSQVDSEMAEAPPREMPDWVDRPPARLRNKFTRTLTSDPFSSDDECYQQIRRKMMIATSEYLDHLLGTESATGKQGEEVRYHLAAVQLRSLGITENRLEELGICKDEYLEYLDSSTDKIVGPAFGKMRRLHVLLEYGEEAQWEFQRRWKDRQLEDRLTLVGVLAASVLMFVGAVHGYLRIDAATGGVYAKRLKMVLGLATILVVLGLLALGHS